MPVIIQSTVRAYLDKLGVALNTISAQLYNDVGQAVGAPVVFDGVDNIRVEGGGWYLVDIEYNSLFTGTVVVSSTELGTLEATADIDPDTADVHAYLPDIDENDIETPSVYIKRVLTSPDVRWLWPGSYLERVQSASAYLVSQMSNRFWRDINVKGKNDDMFPFVTWNVKHLPSTAFEIPLNVVLKKTTRITVMRVDQHPIGKGSYNQARASYKAMFKALTTIWPDTPVYAGDTIIGYITEIRHVNDVAYSVDDEDAEKTITHVGMTIEMDWK